MGSYNCLVDLDRPSAARRQDAAVPDRRPVRRPAPERRSHPLRLLRQRLDVEPLRLAGPDRHRLGGPGLHPQRAPGDRLHRSGAWTTTSTKGPWRTIRRRGSFYDPEGDGIAPRKPRRPRALEQCGGQEVLAATSAQGEGIELVTPSLVVENGPVENITKKTTVQLHSPRRAGCERRGRHRGRARRLPGDRLLQWQGPDDRVRRTLAIRRWSPRPSSRAVRRRWPSPTAKTPTPCSRASRSRGATRGIYCQACVADDRELPHCG